MKILCSIILITFTNILCAQNLQPASIFGNGMVLQHGIKVPIWGNALPNQTVTISISGNQQKVTANATGAFMARLPKMKSGGPFKMTIATTTDSVIYSTVYIGEVWLASGQSNMQVIMKGINNATNELANANYSAIRFFTVAYNMSKQPLNSVKGKWLPCTPENAINFSAVAYFFARHIHVDKKIPVGIISSNWGATPAESFTSAEALITHPSFKDSIDRYNNLQEDWEQLYKHFLIAKDSVTKLNNGSKLPVLPVQKNYPTSVYNGMIAPLVPYGIKGVIWYQGEANGSTKERALLYSSLFPLMITDWRNKWNNPKMPFIFAQLANFKAKVTDPNNNDNWAYLRESQTKALQLPKTGMAVTIDIGEEKDIHPKNKQDVGKRMYLSAQHLVYNSRDAYSGPQYKSMKMNNHTVSISFTQVGKGLVLKADTLSGFAIAGIDKQFYWADAKIEGKKIVLSSTKVTKPVAVRYAWAFNPYASLYNLNGLPAIPFRTDDW